MVLSACETGLGEVVGGEGVMGLPYAFYVAGNKNTILTLWSISDKVTVEFITAFLYFSGNPSGRTTRIWIKPSMAFLSSRTNDIWISTPSSESFRCCRNRNR